MDTLVLQANCYVNSQLHGTEKLVEPLSVVRRDGNYKEVFRTERMTHSVDAEKSAPNEDQINVFSIY